MNYKTLDETKHAVEMYYNFSDNFNDIEKIYDCVDGMYKIGEKINNYENVVVGYLYANDLYKNDLEDCNCDFYYVTFDGEGYNVCDIVGNRLYEVDLCEIEHICNLI